MMQRWILFSLLALVFKIGAAIMLTGCATLPLKVDPDLNVIKDAKARAQCASCADTLNQLRSRAEKQSVTRMGLVISGGAVAATSSVLGIAFTGAEVDRKATISAAIISAVSGLITLIGTLVPDPSDAIGEWYRRNGHFVNGSKWALSENYQEAARSFLECASGDIKAEPVYTE